MNADEIINTSSSNLCNRVDMVDGQKVGCKAPELFEKIRAALMDEFITATN